MQLAIKQRLSAVKKVAVEAIVPFQLNKYIRMFLSLFIVLLGFAQAVDWTQFMSPEKAGALIMALGVLKFAYNSLAPGFGVSAMATDSKIITQRVSTE